MFRLACVPGQANRLPAPEVVQLGPLMRTGLPETAVGLSWGVVSRLGAGQGPRRTSRSTSTPQLRVLGAFRGLLQEASARPATTSAVTPPAMTNGVESEADATSVRSSAFAAAFFSEKLSSEALFSGTVFSGTSFSGAVGSESGVLSTFAVIGAVCLLSRDRAWRRCRTLC